MLRNIGLLLITAFLAFSSLQAQEFDVAAGKSLFKSKCASCHNKNMRDDLTGPALGGYEERWADYPPEDLYRWIRNSQNMINVEGHPRAVELWNEWKPTVMTAFPELTDGDIDNIMAYVRGMYDGSLLPKPAAGEVAASSGAQESSNGWLYWAVFGVLAFLALILSRVIANLNRLQKIAAGGPDEKVPTLWESLLNRKTISFLLFALVVIGGYFTVNNAISLGRQQGYAPEQPIKFSHETHAGLHKIECQYCHDGARRSKHSVIPAANTCMNCHKAIKKGSQYGTAEITKIFASIGYDPTTDKYMEDYEDVSQDSLAKVYKKWIADNYIKDNDLQAIDADGVEEVDEQWANVVSSLTNDLKPNVQGPIEWIRIHNLPDHVYFNHAQHVTVGQVECQECHGKVEEMKVLAQHAPLSMGWCINCHRQTEVKFASNDYYDSYKKYHTELAAGDKDKVTVEDIGGLECQKCHY